MKNKIKLEIGDIVIANHIDDNSKINRHPFLIVAIKKGKAWGLQFSSFKKQNDGTYKSYFSNNENINDTANSFIKYLNYFNFYNQNAKNIELDYKDGLENWSEANPNNLYIFYLKNNIIDEYEFEFLEQLSIKKFYEIIQILNSKEWDSSILQQELLETKLWL